MSIVPSWAKVGAKVVCLKTFDDALSAGFRAPVAGGVYTIREIDPVSIWGCHIRLAEIHNGRASDGIEPSFYLIRFRPVTETDDKTEERIFRTKHQNAPADLERA